VRNGKFQCLFSFNSSNEELSRISDVHFAAYLPVLVSSSGRRSFLLRRIYVKDILVGRENSLPPISHPITLPYLIVQKHRRYVLPLENLPITSNTDFRNIPRVD
jgi:hypothetical protein